MKYVFGKHHLLLIFAAALSLFFYYEFAFKLDRSDFGKLYSLYFGLFAMFLFLWKFGKDRFKSLVLAGIVFRILLCFSLPNLSQDYYRFIWDGELLVRGLNPYMHRPSELIDTLRQGFPMAGDLYRGMGTLSASHYSNYPPVNQFFFFLAAALGGSSLSGKVLVLKLIMLLADLGILYSGTRLLKLLKRPESLILLYFLNPFVILELDGNLHFEGVMMCFFLWGLILLFKGRITGAGIATGVSISVKLIPLMFLPLLLMYLSKGTLRPARRDLYRSLMFAVITLAVVLLSFLPFLSPTNLMHFNDSVGLWFSTFEFNGSLYYIARAIGYQIKGYNIIGSIGPWIPALTIFTVLLLCLRPENKKPEGLITSMALAITVYLFISTTVHPWYLTTPLLLTLLLDKRYALVWTGLAALSYFAYSMEPYRESTLLLVIQYSLVFYVFIREMILKRPIRAF